MFLAFCFDFVVAFVIGPTLIGNIAARSGLSAGPSFPCTSFLHFVAPTAPDAICLKSAGVCGTNVDGATCCDNNCSRATTTLLIIRLLGIPIMIAGNATIYGSLAFHISSNGLLGILKWLQSAPYIGIALAIQYGLLAIVKFWSICFVSNVRGHVRATYDIEGGRSLSGLARAGLSLTPFPVC